MSAVHWLSTVVSPVLQIGEVANGGQKVCWGRQKLCYVQRKWDLGACLQDPWWKSKFGQSSKLTRLYKPNILCVSIKSRHPTFLENLGILCFTSVLPGLFLFFSNLEAFIVYLKICFSTHADKHIAFCRTMSGIVPSVYGMCYSGQEMFSGKNVFPYYVMKCSFDVLDFKEH